MSKIGDFFTKAAINFIARNVTLTDQRMINAVLGGRSDSGENVGVHGSLQLDTVWACVRLISQTAATLPLFYYVKDSKGRGVLSADHPLYNILHDQPNADMTASVFWQVMIAALLLWGNAFASISRIGGRIVAITPLLPDRLTILRNSDGSLKYVYRIDGQTEEFVEDDILHIKGFSLDGYFGLSIIAQAKQQLGIAMAAEKSAASFFRNGMRPSAVVTAPKFLADPQRAEAKGVINRFSGSLAAGGVPLLEGGFEFKDVSMPPDDAQLLETRGFSVEQICWWFSVPPIMIGHMEKSTAWGTGLEQMMLWFLTFTLRPILKNIEQSITKALIPVGRRGAEYAEFNVDALMRTDSKARAELYQALAMNGLRTRNELRALDNEPPLPGGDSLTVQVNLIPIDLLGTVARLPTEKPVDPGFKEPGPTIPAPIENQDNPKSTTEWWDLKARVAQRAA